MHTDHSPNWRRTRVAELQKLAIKNLPAPADQHDEHHEDDGANSHPSRQLTGKGGGNQRCRAEKGDREPRYSRFDCTALRAAIVLRTYRQLTPDFVDLLNCSPTQVT